MMIDGVLDIAGAAAFLKVSKSTIRRRMDIPRHYLPGTRRARFIPQELLDWLQSEQPVASSQVEQHGNGWMTVSLEDEP
jgi:hypothetical protein